MRSTTTLRTSAGRAATWGGGTMIEGAENATRPWPEPLASSSRRTT